MACIKPLETVERALEIFRAINVLGGATISDLARFTGMSRAAVNRYVVTLESLGYADRTMRGTTYRVSTQALELTSGLKVDDWIRRDATPEMEKLSLEIGWPVGLETVREARLQILTNTDHISPFVVRPVSTDLRLPLIGRASGYVLLSQMSDTLLRDLLAAVLEDDPGLYKRLGLTPQKLSRILATTSSNGFALQRVPRADWTVIAVPVHARAKFMLSLSTRYRNKVVGAEVAVREFVPKLTSTATRIAQRLSRQPDADEA